MPRPSFKRVNRIATLLGAGMGILVFLRGVLPGWAGGGGFIPSMRDAFIMSSIMGGIVFGGSWGLGILFKALRGRP